MKEIKAKYELDQKVNGVELMQYMADMLEKNDNQQVEIERGKLSVSILKQMNNRSRLIIDAQKCELKMKSNNNALQA